MEDPSVTAALSAELAKASQIINSCLQQQHLVRSNKALCAHLCDQLSGLVEELHSLQASGRCMRCNLGCVSVLTA